MRLSMLASIVICNYAPGNRDSFIYERRYPRGDESEAQTMREIRQGLLFVRFFVTIQAVYDELSSHPTSNLTIPCGAGG